MKQTTMILVLILLLTSCRSKHKVVESKKIERTEIDSTKIDSTSEEKKVLKKVDLYDQKVKNETKENSGDITIKGKVDSTSTDFGFHNVINGDTLSSVYIHGNATFEIKNKWKEKKETKDSVSSSSNLNLIAQTARKVVSQKTMKKLAEKINTSSKDLKVKGSTAPIYIILGVILLVSVVLYIFINKFKKK